MLRIHLAVLGLDEFRGCEGRAGGGWGKGTMWVHFERESYQQQNSVLDRAADADVILHGKAAKSD